MKGIIPFVFGLDKEFLIIVNGCIPNEKNFIIEGIGYTYEEYPWSIKYKNTKDVPSKKEMYELALSNYGKCPIVDLSDSLWEEIEKVGKERYKN